MLAATVVEAINEAATEYGIVVPIADRVAIGHYLARRPAGSLSPEDVEGAFAQQRLGAPSRRFTKAVVARIRELGHPPTLTDVLLAFRLWAIDALSAEFGAGKSRGREESLRNHLRGYLTSHALVETRTGRGRTDLYVPKLDSIIEVKVWSGRSTFDEGVEELGRYIHTQRPSDAFIVVFGDRDPLPSIARSHRDPFGDSLEIEGLQVPVIVVPFEGDPPSKALRRTRARSRRG